MNRTHSRAMEKSEIRWVVSVSFSVLCVAVILFDLGFDPFVHADRLSALGAYKTSRRVARVLEDGTMVDSADNATNKQQPSEEKKGKGDAAGAGAPTDKGNLFDLAGFSSRTTGKPTTPCGRREGSTRVDTQQHCNLRSWIQSDLDPWRSTGITAKSVTRALALGTETNRYVIQDGKLFMSEHKSKSKWGDSKRWYNAWALLELLDMYPGEVPDVDIAINTADNPKVGAEEMYPIGKKLGGKVVFGARPWNMSKGKSPPALFSVCRNDENIDLLWPQYNIWGMDWEGMGMREPPWCVQFPKLRETWLHKGIQERPGKLFWRGQLKSNPSIRGGLVRCRTTLLPRNDRAAFDVEVNGVVIQKGGRAMPGIPTKYGKQVAASDRCNAKYLMHLEGRTFSLAQLPQAGCGSLMVMGPHRYYTLIERAYRSNGFFLPVQLPVYNPGGDEGAVIERGSCESVSAAIKWAESSNGAAEAELVAAEAANWTGRELRMQGIHRYMMEMLKEYAKIMIHKPNPKGLREVSRSLVDRNTARRQRCAPEELDPQHSWKE